MKIVCLLEGLVLLLPKIAVGRECTSTGPETFDGT
jgi:hypothetical protein